MAKKLGSLGNTYHVHDVSWMPSEHRGEGGVHIQIMYQSSSLSSRRSHLTGKKLALRYVLVIMLYTITLNGTKMEHTAEQAANT